MPTVDTKLFGALVYEESQVIQVPSGMPGLPHTQRLLPVSQATVAPFVFFQSIADPALSLLALPIAIATSDFQLFLSAEDRAELKLDPDVEPNSLGLGVFVLVSVAEDQIPTANLLAPLVICFANNRAVQAIQPLGEDYLRYPIPVTVAGSEQC